jgi:hypothetical protein
VAAVASVAEGSGEERSVERAMIGRGPQTPTR